MKGKGLLLRKRPGVLPRADACLFTGKNAFPLLGEVDMCRFSRSCYCTGEPYPCGYRL